MSERDNRDLRETRKKPARGVHVIPGQPTIVYVTVCTHDREPWLAASEHCDAITQLWRFEATHWRVGLFVLMPDHVHFLAAMTDETRKLDDWMRYWKRRFGQMQNLGSKALQELHWDTRVRSLSHFLERSDYIRENPVRSGLVTKAEDWPYTRVVHELEWFGG